MFLAFADKTRKLWILRFLRILRISEVTNFTNFDFQKFVNYEFPNFANCENSEFTRFDFVDAWLTLVAPSHTWQFMIVHCSMRCFTQKRSCLTSWLRMCHVCDDCKARPWAGRWRSFAHCTSCLMGDIRIWHEPSGRQEPRKAQHRNHSHIQPRRVNEPSVRMVSEWCGW